MPNAEVTYFFDRLRSLVNTRVDNGPGDRWQGEDGADLTIEVAAYLREALGVPALEAELAAASQIDRDALVKFAEGFAAIGSSDATAFAMTFPDGTNFDWQRPVERLRDLLESLRKPEELEEIEVGLRLSLISDSAFERLVIALRAGHPFRDELEATLLTKLAFLSDEEALEFWGRQRNEVDPSREFHLVTDGTVAPNDFFAVGDARDARARIARYLAVVRPLLIRKTLEGGQTRVPAGNIGIGTVPSWTAPSASTRQRSISDRVVARSLGRIVACLPDELAPEFARALGVPVDGFFVGGRAAEEAKRSFHRDGNQRPPAARTFDELPKLLHIAELRSRVKEAPLARALRAYKLGLEVIMTPELAAEMSKRREERLQRELCRFLVERDILAYGTKFGWAETDVRGHDEIGAAIIETKILKHVPSQADVNRWLTQLGTYMDQEQGRKAIHGVLVFYNFTPSTIFTPAVPLRAKYAMVSINLCPYPPSKRKASIEIAPGTDGSGIVELVQLGNSAGPALARKKKTGAKKRTSSG